MTMMKSSIAVARQKQAQNSRLSSKHRW